MEASAIVQTSDHTDDFFVGLKDIGAKLSAEPKHLLCVMMSESGARSNAHNPHGGASGLIQFMPATLQLLGWGHGAEAFRELSSTEQLPYVEAYFSPHRGHLPSVAAIYTATFLPALVEHAADPDFVLTAENGPLGWAYGPNSVFDVNHDMAITVAELEQAVNRNCRGPRWAELVTRLDGIDAEVVGEPNATFRRDLRTTIGIQVALAQLGMDPGPIDGIPGRRTLLAVMLFQRTHGLKVDGIVGPDTRRELSYQLTLLAS
jgi:hypothetical protein